MSECLVPAANFIRYHTFFCFFLIRLIQYLHAKEKTVYCRKLENESVEN